MQDEAYRGSGAPGDDLLGTVSDRRVTQIVEEFLTHDPMGKAAYRTAADPLRTYQMYLMRGMHQTPPQIAVVLHAMPHLGWYKVQTGTSNGWLPCCSLVHGSTNPLGPREITLYRPNSRVLVFKPVGVAYGVILGAVPDQLIDNKVQLPDWLWQGSNTGLKRSQGHMYPIKSLAQQGNVRDFSNMAPVDSVGEEMLHVTETGHALMMDSFQAMLRLNEMCGIFLNHFDSYTRLAGYNFDFFSGADSWMHRVDEGESRIHIKRFVYPWEAIGLYSPGTDIAKEIDDTDVHYTAPRGKVDLGEGDEDIQSIDRAGEHHGYPGQGGFDYVQTPPKTDGVLHYKEEIYPEGLSADSRNLDGGRFISSAKEIGIVKSVKLLMAKEIKPPEHGKGDDARADNYKFSSMFGEAEDHNVGDIVVDGELRSLRKIAGVMDVISYYRDWKRLHPFHYHKGDYSTPLPGDSNFSRVQDHMDWSELSDEYAASDPTPQMLKIDHRYGDVEYYQRESFLWFHDDGGVSLGCGYGSDIYLGPVGIRMNTPADVTIVPARSFIVKCGAQSVISAHGSVDMYSATKDARVRAYKNLHLLGEQSVLIENKSEDRLQLYDGLIGEDVHPSGIVFKTTTDFVVLCSDMFVRSDIADSLPGGKGQIVMDCGQNKGSFVVNGVKAEFFVRNGVTMYFSAQVDGPITSSHRFGRNQISLAADVAIRGNLEMCCDVFAAGNCSGNIYLCGTLVALGDIMAGGSVSSDDPDSPLPPNNPSTVVVVGATIQEKCEIGARITLRGETERSKWVGPWHSRTFDVAWSYRDVPSCVQYKTETFKWLESRWQQIVRMGGGDGGIVWDDEPPVLYQGQELYPWPGRKKWIEEPTFHFQAEASMYDRAAGNDKDRPDPYVRADGAGRELKELETATMAEVFTIII